MVTFSYWFCKQASFLCVGVLKEYKRSMAWQCDVCTLVHIFKGSNKGPHTRRERLLKVLWSLQMPMNELTFSLLVKGLKYDCEWCWLKLTAVRACYDNELFAGHNWKQLSAIFIILLVLLAIGIRLWWILDSESKSQLTLVSTYQCIPQNSCWCVCISYTIIYLYMQIYVTRSGWPCWVSTLYKYIIQLCVLCLVMSE